MKQDTFNLQQFFYGNSHNKTAGGERLVLTKDFILDFDKGISPEQRVDYKKQRKLRALAQIWMSKNKQFANAQFQIDIITIIIDLESRKAKILYFQNAIPGD